MAKNVELEDKNKEDASTSMSQEEHLKNLNAHSQQSSNNTPFIRKLYILDKY